MAFNFKNRIDVKKFFQIVLVGFLAVQIISWIISSVSDIPIIKGGNMLFLFLIVILLVTLFSIGKDLKDFDIKRDGLLLLLVFGAIILLFLILPTIIPEIFSTSGIDFKNFLRENIGTILKIGTGVGG